MILEKRAGKPIHISTALVQFATNLSKINPTLKPKLDSLISDIKGGK